MKLIKPYYEIITPINGEEILKNIELAARTCYKSEDKIGTLIKCNKCSVLISSERTEEKCGNLENYCYSTGTTVVQGIPSHIQLCNKLLKLGHEAMLEFGGMITVKFVCDRGVSHELVRHRVASFAQESTRYCNYGKDEHIQFIIPCWLDINEGIYDLPKDYDNFSEYDGTLTWLDSIYKDEIKYNNLVNQINPKTGKVDLRFRKWTPQEARSILPNSLKTEINVSANIREWRHIFKQRTAKAAHPQMRELMCPLLDEFKSKIPLLFDDINF